MDLSSIPIARSINPDDSVDLTRLSPPESHTKLALFERYLDGTQWDGSFRLIAAVWVCNVVCLDPLLSFLYEDGKLWQFVNR
jgi:hypothetical protein